MKRNWFKATRLWIGVGSATALALIAVAVFFAFRPVQIPVTGGVKAGREAILESAPEKAVEAVHPVEMYVPDMSGSTLEWEMRTGRGGAPVARSFFYSPDMSGSTLEWEMHTGRGGAPAARSFFYSPDMSGSTLEWELRTGKAGSVTAQPEAISSSGLEFGYSYWQVVGPAGEPPVSADQ